MSEAIKWAGIAAVVVIGLLWWNNHSWLCDAQCRETQQESRQDRLARPSASATRRTHAIVGAPCIGQITGKPGVWKVDGSNGKIGCWTGQ